MTRCIVCNHPRANNACWCREGDRGRRIARMRFKAAKTMLPEVYRAVHASDITDFSRHEHACEAIRRADALLAALGEAFDAKV